MTLPVGVPAVEVTVKAIGTAWFTVDGSGESEVIVAVVAAGFTTWVESSELVAKLVLPTYVAVSVLVPADVNVISHDGLATVPEQPTVPSLTLTAPVGVPEPGGVATTDQVTVTGPPPYTEGLGEMVVMVVVVGARFTVWATVSALRVKFASPG